MIHVPGLFILFFFLNDTATPEIYPFPPHDALPIPPFTPPNSVQTRQLTDAEQPTAPNSPPTGRSIHGAMQALFAKRRRLRPANPWPDPPRRPASEIGRASGRERV